jgi:hypothetical protein
MRAKRKIIPLFLVSAVGLSPWLNSVANPCKPSSITSPATFTGNDGKVFALEDGSTWKVKFGPQLFNLHRPSVVICPSDEKLLVNGKAVKVVRLTDTSKTT